MTFLLAGTAIPQAVRDAVDKGIPLEKNVHKFFDTLHALCGNFEGCHFAVAYGNTIYRVGSIYIQHGDAYSCEPTHISITPQMSKLYTKHNITAMYATPIDSAIDPYVLSHGPMWDGFKPAFFHRDRRGSIATMTFPGGVRVQTSLGYASMLPPGAHYPCVTHVDNFIRFLDAEEGDELSSKAFSSVCPLVWTHEVFGSQEGFTFNT